MSSRDQSSTHYIYRVESRKGERDFLSEIFIKFPKFPKGEHEKHMKFL